MCEGGWQQRPCRVMCRAGGGGLDPSRWVHVCESVRMCARQCRQPLTTVRTTDEKT